MKLNKSETQKSKSAGWSWRNANMIGVSRLENHAYEYVPMYTQRKSI